MALQYQLQLPSFFLVISLSLVLLVSYATSSCRNEDYWQIKLPKVPMPKAIRNNLVHYCGGYSEEYFKGNPNYENKPNVNVLGIQPVTVVGWKYKEDTKQDSVAIQPVTIVGWKYKEDKMQKDVTIQPVTIVGWKYNEDNIKETSLYDQHIEHNNINSNHEDLTSGSLFFIQESLHLGKKLKHDFQKSSQVPILPKHIVQSIPFEENKFTEIIDLFSISNESAQATAIKETLDICLQRPKVKKENRTCAQSMEDVVDFVVQELGTNDVKVRMMDNIEVPNGIQDYVITKVKKLKVPRNTAVACHKMSYPYVLYYCHHQQDIGQYDVTLVSPTSSSNAIQTTAVCHYDTYAWQPNVPALRYLGIHPGDAPVCHFSAIDDMFWSLKVDSEDLDMVE